MDRTPDGFTYTEADFAYMLRQARELGESDAENEMYGWHASAPLPDPNLSGEYGDDLSPDRLARYVGWYHYGSAMYEMTDDEASEYSEGLAELCDEYEDAFTTRVALLAGDDA